MRNPVGARAAIAEKKLGSGCNQVAAAGKCECICECAFGVTILVFYCANAKKKSKQPALTIKSFENNEKEMNVPLN